jgi:hypothetical protein
VDTHREATSITGTGPYYYFIAPAKTSLPRSFLSQDLAVHLSLNGMNYSDKVYLVVMCKLLMHQLIHRYCPLSLGG